MGYHFQKFILFNCNLVKTVVTSTCKLVKTLVTRTCKLVKTSQISPGGQCYKTFFFVTVGSEISNATLIITQTRKEPAQL